MSGSPLGSVFGLPVIESRNLPAGVDAIKAELPSGAPVLYVRDAWRVIQLPVMMVSLRTELRRHLDGLVRSTERRLGLADV